MSLALRQFRFELLKLFARKRTWLGFGIFFALELGVFAMLSAPGPQRGFERMMKSYGAAFESYGGGVTLAFFVFVTVSFLLGGTFLALVAGDIVAKEVEDGTMRMTLCRPASRLRVLTLKYAACVVHHFAFLFFIELSLLAVAVAFRGAGGFFAFTLDGRFLGLYEQSDGLLKYFLSMPVYACSFLIVTTLGFFFSCCNMKPVVSTVLAVVVIIIDRILYSMPPLEDYRGWFMHSRLESWMNVFSDHIGWWGIANDYLWLFALNGSLFIVGATIFCRRDFKS